MKTLITSAAYIETEMAAEFGHLPPCFLPLGNERLLHYQIEELSVGKAGQVFVSLPQSFQIEALYEEQLSVLGVEIIRVPDGLSLGKSVLYCIEKMPRGGGLQILHGDTLFSMDEIQSEASDVWALSQSDVSYSWGIVFSSEGKVIGVCHESLVDETSIGADVSANILVGYLKFSDSCEFANDLRYANGDFLTALARYSSKNEVRAIICNSWQDFGHLQTFFQARSAFVASRSFNNLVLENGVIWKASAQAQKIRGEAYWLSELPATLQIYAGRLIDQQATNDGGYQYATEYEALPTLQELFVFGHLDERAWRGVLASCKTCLDDFAAVTCERITVNVLESLGVKKTQERLDCFERETGLDLSRPSMLNGRPLPSPRDIAEEMMAIVKASSQRLANIMHGDFCFSNILYNSRTSRVRLIDPRGTVNGTDLTVWGDVRYDMAKLAHSVIGRYDLILAGRYYLEHDYTNNISFKLELPGVAHFEWIERYFWSMKVADIRFDNPVVKALLVLLFLTMLPLHADRSDRQNAFLANALRLYHMLFEEGA